MPLDRHRCIDDFLHPAAYFFGIFLFYGMPDRQVAIVTVRNGNINHDAAVGIDVVHRFAKNYK